MAKLLVSVRSGAEAMAAVAGGAAIIDVKEPLHGSLGRAPLRVWREVRDAVPASIPVSVALGELVEWLGDDGVRLPDTAWAGISFRKLGLSQAPPDWIDRWSDRCGSPVEAASGVPAWVAVVYIDWEAARAPDPGAIIGAAAVTDQCQGVLFDTWDKSRRPCVDLTWKRHVDHVRASGRFVALAGSLDIDAIRRLAPLAPDIFAVRGAACTSGDRLGPIDPDRVSALARAARGE